jgi:hypothetical protein
MPRLVCNSCGSQSGVRVEKSVEGCGYVAWCVDCWDDGRGRAIFGRSESEVLERLLQDEEIDG